MIPHSNETENHNTTTKRGFSQKSWRYRSRFPDSAKKTRQRHHTLTKGRDYLQGNSKALLPKVKTDQIRLNCVADLLHLCGRAGDARNRHRRNADTPATANKPQPVFVTVVFHTYPEFFYSKILALKSLTIPLSIQNPLGKI